MTVAELIRELRRMPPGLKVTTWDAEADENLPIVQVLYEDGTSAVALLTHAVDVVDAVPEG